MISFLFGKPSSISRKPTDVVDCKDKVYGIVLQKHISSSSNNNNVATVDLDFKKADYQRVIVTKEKEISEILSYFKKISVTKPRPKILHAYKLALIYSIDKGLWAFKVTSDGELLENKPGSSMHSRYVPEKKGLAELIEKHLESVEAISETVLSE